jgi:hypothetical protein
MKNSIKTNINEGIEILNKALKHYENGDNSTAYKLYEYAGQFLNEANEYSKTQDGIISLKYGDNNNFGVIYKIFESNTKNLLKNKEGIKNLKRIMILIRENAVLKNEFDVYNTFTNPVNVENVEKYVNESISLIKQYKNSQLKEENRKLINLIKDCHLNEQIDINDDEINLFEDIEFMLLNEKKFNNINEYNQIEKRLCEYVSDNNQIKSNNKNLDELYENIINDMVSTHEKVLTEDEIKLINDVNNPIKAKKLFNENKSEVISLINEEIKKNIDVEQWNVILEKVSNKNFEHKNALTDIAEFIEIKNQLSE